MRRAKEGSVSLGEEGEEGEEEMPWDWSHPWAACSRISGGRLEIGLMARRGDFLAFAMGSTADEAPGFIG